MRTRTMKKERRPLNRKKVKAKKTKKRYSDVLTVARQCLKKVNSEAIPDLNESCCSSKKSKTANSGSNDSWGGEKCSSFIRDKSAAHDKLVLRHPKCPDQFQIVRGVSDSRNKWSVVARQRIESDTAFGPFMGSVVMTSDKNMVQKLKDYERSRICFQIAKKCNEYTFFDGSKSNNWMPHIRTASNDFNCVVFLSENNNGDYRIYYKTIKDINPEEEVIVNNEGIVNPDQYADKIAKGIRENQKQLDIQKRRMIKKGKEMQKDMLKKTKEMERLLSKKEKALRDQKTIGSVDLYQEAELEDMEALGKEMVRRGKEIEQMFNKSEVSSSRRSVRSSLRRAGSNKSYNLGKMFSTRCSPPDKKAESLSSRMERLSNVSKVKSKLSGCSKDFCPCAAALGLDTGKAEQNNDKEENSDSEESESSKVNRLISQALEPAAAKKDSHSSRVQRLMSQITQELAEDLSSEEQSEDQSSFNNDGKEDEESSQVTEETHTISSVGQVSDKPQSSSSSSSGSSSSESGSSVTLPRPSNSAGASEKSEDEFENLFGSAGGYSSDKMDDEGSEQSETDNDDDDDEDNSEKSEGNDSEKSEGNDSEKSESEFDLFGSPRSTGEKNEETTNEVPALTSEMKRQVDVIKSASNNLYGVIVSRFGFDITGEKIQNFMGIWDYGLENSDVINFYMTMIRNRSRDKPSMNMVQFLYTDFYKALVRGDPTHTWTEHCDIYSCDVLFIPAKREHHWTLIAVDCVRKTITSYCYEKMEHPEVPRVVVEFLEQQHRWKRGRKLDFDEWKMDHQHRYRNGGGFNESAAFICTQAEFLSRNMELEYHGDDNVIKTMVYEIVNQELVRSDFEARVHRCATEKCPIKRAEIADIPPLSREQQMTFDVLMREKQYPEHSLVHKFGFNITSERAQNFLGDKDHCHLDGIINFYFIMIRNRAHDNSRMPMVQFLYTDFYKALTNEEPTHHWTEHCDIDHCDYLFIPAKRENKWTMIAVDCVHKSITSYSLCQLDHPDVPESLKEFLEHQHKWRRGKKLNLQEWEVDSHVCEVGSNYQHSLGDTAAYICVVADLLSRNLQPDFDRKKLDLAKKTIIVEIAGVNLTRNGFVEKEHRKSEPAPWPLNWKGSNDGVVQSQRSRSNASQKSGSVASQKKRRRIEMFKKAVNRSRSRSRSVSSRR